MNSQLLPSPSSSPSFPTSQCLSNLSLATTTSLIRTSSKRRKYNNNINNNSTESLPIATGLGINFTTITPPPDSPHPNLLCSSTTNHYQSSSSSQQQQQYQQQQFIGRQYFIERKKNEQEEEARRKNLLISVESNLNSSHEVSFGKQLSVDDGGTGVESVLIRERVMGEGEKMSRGEILEKQNLRTSSSTIVSSGDSVESNSTYGGIPLRRSTDESMMRKNAIREVGNRDQFVQSLVGASVLAIESIWGPVITPNSTSPFSPLLPSEPSTSVPLRWFVTEVLRRSRTSCSTLQVALYYLHKIRKQVLDVLTLAHRETELNERRIRLKKEKEMFELVGRGGVGEEGVYPSPPLTPIDLDDINSFNINQSETEIGKKSKYLNSPILCGRRMFLAALIGASKFLQDRNFSNRAWAKISGLTVGEINSNERAFLGLLKFELFLGAGEFLKWTERLAALSLQTISPLQTIPTSSPPSFTTSSTISNNKRTSPPPMSTPLTPPLELNALGLGGIRRTNSEYTINLPSSSASTVSQENISTTISSKDYTITRNLSAPQLVFTSDSSTTTTLTTGNTLSVSPMEVDEPIISSTVAQIRPVKGIPSNGIKLNNPNLTLNLPPWPPSTSITLPHIVNTPHTNDSNCRDGGREIGVGSVIGEVSVH